VTSAKVTGVFMMDLLGRRSIVMPGGANECAVRQRQLFFLKLLDQFSEISDFDGLAVHRPG
jgi:hypothetical protein